RADSRWGREGSRLRDVVKGTGRLGQRLPEARPRQGDVEGGTVQAPARCRIRAGEDDRLRADGPEPGRLHQALPARGALIERGERTRLLVLILPAAVVFGAFFLLPMARLVAVGFGGPAGLAAYASIVTEPRYFRSLVSTVVLAAAVTGLTLVIATIAGVFLQRNVFPGRSVLVAMLTFPLAFPGVVVGFMVIMLAGRQGLIGD